MGVITGYPDDTSTTDSDKFLTSDSSGATKLTSASTLKNYIVSDGSISTAKIADDAVTDAKLVNGKVYRRQGGSATDWSAVGTTTYDVSGTDVKIQTGRVYNNASPKAVTFPVAFSQTPTVFVSVVSVNAAACFAVALSPTTTGFNCQVYDAAGNTNNGQDVAWIAIGV